MPIQTIPEYTGVYHSGFKVSDVVGRTYRDDAYFISQWAMDDISTGYALDSQNTNNLLASGSPTQVAGYMQASGVEFDGVNDAFYLPWASGSGIQGIVMSQFDLAPASAGPNMSFWARLYIPSDAFTQDRILFSKWNDVGSDEEWMIGINPSGGVFWGFKRTTGLVYFANTVQSGLIPKDRWFNFGFGFRDVNSTSTTTGPFFHVHVDDTIFCQVVGNYIPEETGASGLFCIGAANVGLNPSGFFKGKMEDVRFHNGRSILLDEWNAYQSGNAPTSTRPEINSFHPSLVAHFTLDEIYNGDVGHLSSIDYIVERENNLPFPLSGTYSAHDMQIVPAATRADLTQSSGIASSDKNNVYFAKHESELPFGLRRGGNLNTTIMYWAKSAKGNDDSDIMGFTPTYGPWTITMLNNFMNYSYNYQGDSAQTHTIGNTNQRVNTPAWGHLVWKQDIARNAVDAIVSGTLLTPNHGTRSGLFKSIPNTGSLYSYMGILGVPGGALTPSGLWDEIIIFNEYLPDWQVQEFYTNNSGFLQIADATSGMVGGYVLGIDTLLASGTLGGYVLVGTPSGAYLGGYTSGVAPGASGTLGGYVLVGTPNQGTLGGWLTGKNNWDATIGGFAARSAEQTNILGAYIVGSEVAPVQSEFYAFFNVIGRDKSEFDAQVAAYKSLNTNFDAKAIVYIDEQKPGVNIITPAIPETSGTVPLTVNFEAEASGLNGKHIVLTYWYFSDVPTTSGSNNSASGTYTTSHTFGLSGVFTVTFVAVDNQGLVNSDRVIINTASGLVVPEIQLTATPESGTAPLSVAFSGVISSAPYPIVDKYIQFGDGTFSASTDSIYKLYPVVGCYIPTFRARDSRGVVVTDTTVVGVNN